MRHNVAGKKLGRDAEHRKALKRNLAISLIEYGSIETTVQKAKYAKPFIEKLVTRAKKDDLHAIRVLKKKLDNEDAVRKLVEVIGPKFAKRKGGYTRIVKMGFRDGDKAEMARIEWVGDKNKDDKDKSEKKTKKKSKKAEDAKDAKEEPKTEEVVENEEDKND